MYQSQKSKLFKLIIILFLLFCYFINDSVYSIILMLPIGFVFSYKTRTKKIDYIDKLILAFLSLMIFIFMYPSIDVFGLLRKNMIAFSKILGLIMFLFGYYFSYFLTKLEE